MKLIILSKAKVVRKANLPLLMKTGSERKQKFVDKFRVVVLLLPCSYQYFAVL